MVLRQDVARDRVFFDPDSKAQSLTEKDVKASKETFKELFQKPEFTNYSERGLQALAELQKFMVEPLDKLSTPSVLPNTSAQLQTIHGLREHWHEAIKKLDSIHLAEKGFAKLALDGLDKNDPNYKEAKQKFDNLGSQQKDDRSMLVEATAKAEGQFWNSLSQSKNWAQQKSITDLLVRGDYKEALERATAKKQKELDDANAAAKLANGGAIKELNQKPVVTQKDILNELSTYRGKDASYNISTDAKGNVFIGVKRDSDVNIPKPKNPNEPTLREQWEQTKGNFKRLFCRRNTNEREVVKELLKGGQATGCTTFNITTDNRMAVRETLKAMYENEKNKELIAEGKQPTSPHVFKELTLTVKGENGEPVKISSLKDLAEHQKHPLLKGITLNEAVEMGKGEMKSEQGKRAIADKKDFEAIQKMQKSQKSGEGFAKEFKEEFKKEAMRVRQLVTIDQHPLQQQPAASGPK